VSKMEGTVYLDLPKSHSRLSDFLNYSKAFFYLEAQPFRAASFTICSSYSHTGKVMSKGVVFGKQGGQILTPCDLLITSIR
jgi:hypothetical protein